MLIFSCEDQDVLIEGSAQCLKELADTIQQALAYGSGVTDILPDNEGKPFQVAIEVISPEDL